jgi:lauroyl/myristoyl acyltransferase
MKARAMNRIKMIKELTQNEIDWIVGDPEFENVQLIVDFLARGGYYTYPDDKLAMLYNQLKA